MDNLIAANMRTNESNRKAKQKIDNRIGGIDFIIYAHQAALGNHSMAEYVPVTDDDRISMGGSIALSLMYTVKYGNNCVEVVSFDDYFRLLGLKAEEMFYKFKIGDSQEIRRIKDKECTDFWDMEISRRVYAKFLGNAGLPYSLFLETKGVTDERERNKIVKRFTKQDPILALNEWHSVGNLSLLI